MFLYGYLGNDGGFPTWSDVIREHADWLELTAQIVWRCLPDNRTLGIALIAADSSELAPRLDEAHGWLLAALRSSEVDGRWPREPQAYPALAHSDNAVSVKVSLGSGELSITVPPTTPQQFYYARTPDGYLFGDDLRVFPRLMEVELDGSGIYALFHYGAVPAPLTIWQGVRRAPSGQCLRFPAGSPGLVYTSVVGSANVQDGEEQAPNPDDRVRDTLDALLARVPPGAILYFSGGVDSSLLAARLVHAGRRDVRLINYAFDREDQESLFARGMASRLGLPCEVVYHDPSGVAQVLERLAQDYSFPFADLSTIPMSALVHASTTSGPDFPAAVEGTGADGAFGLGDKYPRWRRTYALPGFIRRQVDGVYVTLRLWEHPSQAERAARFLRKSGQMPLGYAVVAQNSLDGIVYDVSPEARTTVAHAVRGGIEVLSGGASSLDQVSVIDVVWACAGRMAPKSFDPLRRRGIQPIYPFLEPAMFRVSRSLGASERCPGGEAKAILKRLLAAHVPRDWVYRHKRGFTPPFRRIFADKPMQAYLHDVVLASGNPLLSFCRLDVLRRLIQQVRDPAKLTTGVYEFLWALTFASGWLEQQARRPQLTK